MINKVKSFLSKHKSLDTDIDKDKFINDFITEMEIGLTSKSSLEMIPTYIYSIDGIKDNSNEYIILDAGGTNLRGCIGYIKDGKPYFKNVKTRKMFGVDKLINKKYFYNGFHNFIKSITDKELDIGCCFSFTCDMNKDLDGKILYFGKNIKTLGVIGTYFGKELKAKFNSDINISIINDAIATNLGSQYDFNKDVNYISYIWGTGVNASYYEKISNIKKQHNKIKIGSELINIESCGFNKFLLSDFEETQIKLTGKNDMFEKTSGGVYLANIFNNAINTAYKEKLISLNKKIKFDLIKYSSMFENKDPIFKDDKSYELSKLIIIELIKRVAKLNALVVSSIILKINNMKPYYVTLEGSTINKLPYLKEYFIKYVNECFHNYEIKFLTGDNLNFKGALLLATQFNR